MREIVTNNIIAKLRVDAKSFSIGHNVIPR